MPPVAERFVEFDCGKEASILVRPLALILCLIALPLFGLAYADEPIEKLMRQLEQTALFRAGRCRAEASQVWQRCKYCHRLAHPIAR